MKRNFGIRAKLMASFVIFSVIVILILWVLEIVFLDDVYRIIKENSVRSYVESLSGMSDESYQDTLNSAAQESDICTSVYDETLNLLSTSHAGGNCIPHNLSKETLLLFYHATSDCAGNHFETYLPAEDLEEILRKSQGFRDPFWDFPAERNEFSFPDLIDNDYECILYSRIISNSAGETRYVVISANIIPMDFTVQTIRFELNLVVGALLLLSAGMTWFLTRIFSDPIVALNRASKRLPEGKFDGTGISGYREVEELSETLMAASQEIGKVDTLRRELLANVSHDLRTPLTLISGYSEVMRDIPGENTPENLQIVIDETHRLSDLVTDLLDLSKLEAGMETIKPESVEMVSFMSDLMNRYDKMTCVSGYNIVFENLSGKIFVFADPVKLNQVIYNLVNNAIHYCGEDRTVIVRQSVAVDRLLIEVIDHGQGIDEEKLSDIWDRYYRVDKNHQSAKVGTGLGLSIVKKVLELHSAEFGVESKKGEGSRFWFSIPCSQTPAEF